MFTSELPLTLDIPDEDDPQIIHYINALPGAGKTWAFDNRVAKPHVTEEHNSVLVYAAPTALLLEEREKALLDLGIPANKIMVITYDHLPSGTNVGLAFRDAITGTGTSRGIPNGSIILCTHECVARAPSSVRWRDRVVMVYDEARACLQDNYALHLPDAAFKYLTEPQEHLAQKGRKVKQRLLSKVSVFETGEDDDSESVYIWRWNNRDIPLPSLETLEEFMPKTNRQGAKAKHVRGFLENIHTSSLDVYVSIARKKDTAEYVISNVFSPSRMFKGYSKVLILSAFFESSQMYQFLTKSTRVNGSVVALKDVTKKLIDKKRMTRLLKRMQHTRLTYIYDLKGRTLSKSDMQQALVVEAPLDLATIKKINAKWHEYYPMKPEFYKTVYASYADHAARATRLTDAAREPAYKLFQHLDERFNILGPVVPHMVGTAIKLQQAFMKHLKMPLETLPIGVNPRYTSYREGDSLIWASEKLDDFNKRNKVFDVPKTGPIIMQLPITAHGLNAFRDLHSCAFLAAMKYSPRESKFMERALPEYNTRIDRTLDYALQLLWRCNVRMPSKDPVLLIVTDLQLATELQARFRRLADYWLGEHRLKLLPIVAPERILKPYKMPSILKYHFDPAESQQRRNANRAVSVKGKEAAELKKRYLQTPEGKRYNQLSALISYSKRTKKDFEALFKERQGLQSFADWKVSEAGVQARKAANKFDPIVSAREALGRLSPNLQSRDERLKILSVIKRSAPELKAEVKAWYTGDKFDHNWKTAQDYGKTYNLGWLFKMAKDNPK